jgi:predicted nucleic acid-binding protein
MRVLVDTSVWSLAFRRHAQDDKGFVEELRELIVESRACLLGVIRQELLSGMTHKEQFQKLKDRLRAFDDIAVQSEDHELAAEIFNTCRKKGIQGSTIDFLICAVAHRRKIALFTSDKDFLHYAKCVELVLHKPRTITSR